MSEQEQLTEYVLGHSDRVIAFLEKRAAKTHAAFLHGEIVSVSGTTFLHGYTSSFGIFRPRY